MRDKLRNPNGRTVGYRQTLKALRAGRVQAVFLAEDTPREMRGDALLEAESAGVPVERVPTMRELGRLCAIQVPAALASVLKDPEQGL